ncbi:conserved hypothetical protein [Bryocella elongata]|uniref:DUF2383 domain-containing protein n=1 Tax=Bryocella elongata TaxID=863522 RepID=A0A1H5W9B1_9BACT|nr:PA2169 family four-helix-bundle protein [Bryocella elongata]SEF96072.1 conserved hypothetical protein [Bryocella elongata]
MANTLDGSAKNREAERVLLDVIKTLQDGQKGFAEVGEHLKDPTLKRYFLAQSLQRANFRAELENELHRDGMPDVSESGSVAGALHRVWADVKAKLGGGDSSLLEAAEEGEKSALDVYRDALEQDLPLPVRELLSEQQAHLLNSQEYIQRNREELVKA